MTVRSFKRAASAEGTRAHSYRLALRQIPALALAALLVGLLSRNLGEIDGRAVVATLAQIGPVQFVAALGLAALSFWAVGRYDAVVHGHLMTGRSQSEAQRAGLTAIAVSQMTGFGLLTGALVRWRMLPGLTLSAAIRITISVTLLFFLGWAVSAALTVLALPSPALASVRPLAWAILAAFVFLAALSLWQPRLAFLRRPPRIPALATLARLVGLAAVDTIAAGLCLAVLLPAEAGVSAADLLPVFLLAFGAGMISGAPGGMGAFELVLLALLPLVAPEPLLAGVLAWRVVYYAVPSLIAAAVLARGARGGPATEARAMAASRQADALLHAAPRAEAGLLRQGDKSLLSSADGTPCGVAARTEQTLTLLGDPLEGATGEAVLAALHGAARNEQRVPCLYKAGARLAAKARRAGWQVCPVAHEAWLRPADFDLSGPACRQLRRKLRKARSAGVEVTQAGGRIPLDEMAALSRAWIAAQGGERGFSMGRFAADYLMAQRVFLARAQGCLVGFVSLHHCDREWTLDLMRNDPGAPDGTMHALVAAAVAEAAAEGIPRLSLAAVPHPAVDRLAARLPKGFRRKLDAGGLIRFKRCFAPDFETLYLAAPSRPALALASVDILREVLWPRPLQPPELGQAGDADGVRRRMGRNAQAPAGVRQPDRQGASSSS